MAALPKSHSSTVNAIYSFHVKREEAQTEREYLGWSEIGQPCDRALWYRFRWAESDNIDGRMARLFDTGHREEARVLRELQDIGCTVYARDSNGKQFAVSSHGGHFRGHADAVVLGLPEAPKTPHLVDVKTIKAKKFDELLKKGMRELFPKYWAQAHGYMGKLNLTRAIFVFVCKDDDRLHAERIEFDAKVFEAFEQRALKIIQATEPPLRISEDPTWFECRFCAFKDICHGERPPRVNCRTCAHSTPTEQGAWHCEKRKTDLTASTQKEACDLHRFIPLLLEKIGKAEDVEGDGDFVIYHMEDGGKFANGAPPLGFTSAEIRAAESKEFLVDPRVKQVREEFPQARIVPSSADAFADMPSDIF